MPNESRKAQVYYVAQVFSYLGDRTVAGAYDVTAAQSARLKELDKEISEVQAKMRIARKANLPGALPCVSGDGLAALVKRAEALYKDFEQVLGGEGVRKQAVRIVVDGHVGAGDVCERCRVEEMEPYRGARR